ncbi:hypothetical protein PMN34_09180, partial [Bifidobacterium pseudocatenulatum]|uniref:hypothetical protein n=1 Tax=Bifidobacterium pseudocatenulatum TaxID=28026 RepID=UPI00232F9F15
QPRGSELTIAPWTATIQSAQLFGHYLFVRRFLHTVCPQRDHPHCRIVRNFRKTIETHSKVVENCKTEKQPNRKTAEQKDSRTKQKGRMAIVIRPLDA